MCRITRWERGIGIAAVVCAVLRPEVAHAQSVDGAFRLGLGGPLIAHESTTLSLAGRSSAPTSAEIDSSQTTFGTASTGAGFTVGYGIGDIVLGGGLLFGSTKNDLGSLGESDATTFTLLPSIEYIFSTDSGFRPFVAGALGYRSTSSSSGAYKFSEGSFLAGPSVGFHGFVTPSFSIDSSLGGFWNKGSAQSGDVELDRSGYLVALTIGVSGWLGGSAPQAQGQPREPGPAPNQTAAQTNAQLPRPATTPATVNAIVEQKDQLSVSMDIPRWEASSLHLVLTGEPQKDGATIQVTISSVLAGQPADNCGQAQLGADGTTFSLTDVKSSLRQGFSSFTTALQGRASVSALESLATTADQASISTCGQRWSIPPAARRRISELVRTFRKNVPANAWSHYDFADCGVAVQYPSSAAKHVIAPQAAVGVQVSTLEFELPDNRGELSIGCAPLPPKEKSSRAILDAARNGMLKNVGANLVKESDVAGGREILFDVSGNQGLAHIQLIGSRLVFAVATPVSGVTLEAANRFVSSVQPLEP